MDIDFSHKIEYVEPIKVEVERGMRGQYGWTISIHAESELGLVGKIQNIDQQLREIFLPKGEEVKGESKEHTD